MRIDIHNHAIPERSLDLISRDKRYQVSLDGRKWTGGNHAEFVVQESFTDPRAKLAELENNDLEAAVISPAPPLFLYNVDAEAGELLSRETNRGLAEFCSYDPRRLRWMAHVPLHDSQRVDSVLREAVSLGAAGVEVGTSIAGRRLDEPEFEPFWAAVEREKLPVLIHPAFNEPSRGLEPYYFQNVIGNMLETTIAAERLICAGVLDRHPDVQIVLVHSGGYFPYQAGRLRHARTVRPELAASPEDPWSYVSRMYFDPITHDRDALRFLVSRVGANRVVMGTDLPFDMALPRPMDALLEAVDESTARGIAEDNPTHLYGFDS